MSKTWFTADCHFQHFNIIEYTNRPFKNVEEMDAELIRRWNERVKADDLIYIIGDFYFHKSKKGNGGIKSFEYYDSRLNGKKIYVMGNHCKSSNPTQGKINALILEMGGINIFCCHNPRDSNNVFPLNLCGHVHRLWKSKVDEKFGEKTIIINVGVDVWNFYPVSFEEIMNVYSKVKQSLELGL